MESPQIQLQTLYRCSHRRYSYKTQKYLQSSFYWRQKTRKEKGNSEEGLCTKSRLALPVTPEQYTDHFLVVMPAVGKRMLGNFRLITKNSFNVIAPAEFLFACFIMVSAFFSTLANDNM